MENLRAMRAWREANAYLREWGPRRVGGPQLPPRIEYALRQIGGLEKFRDTMVGDFIQAFNDAPFVDEDGGPVLSDGLAREVEP